MMHTVTDGNGRELPTLPTRILFRLVRTVAIRAVPGRLDHKLTDV